MTEVCTVMLRFDPEAPWPVLIAAVRDEFTGRPWDWPGAHWPAHPGVVGGRDRLAGGTWLAADPDRGAVAALLNGVRREPPPTGHARPTRGTLALAALAADTGASTVPGIPDRTALAAYDGFHVVRADRRAVVTWSWDGDNLAYQRLTPGDHIIVNLGTDRDDDPLVPHFRPLLAAVPSPPLTGAGTAAAWDGWVDLLRGDGLDPTDERGLIIAHTVDGRAYGSTSATLVALARDGRVRYDFTATPATPDWHRVTVGRSA